MNNENWAPGFPTSDQTSLPLCITETASAGYFRTESCKEENFYVCEISDNTIFSKCSCGEAQKKTRIVGGVETDVNEYPWQVIPYYNI